MRKEQRKHLEREVGHTQGPEGLDYRAFKAGRLHTEGVSLIDSLY